MHILLTGHTSGIGKNLCELLLQNNYQITGIARSKIDLVKPNLNQIQADLTNLEALKKVCNKISKTKFDIVILNAGYNDIKPAESYSINETIDICTLNFTAHAAILRACLPGLLNQKGWIFGIGSFSGLEVEKWNNFYGSAKAGLHHLLENIFNQYRKQDLKVTNIIPDIVNSSFYNHQQYKPSLNKDTYIESLEIAKLINNLIVNPPAYVPTQMVIRPQRFELVKQNIKK